MSALPRKRTLSDTTGMSALCHNVWPDRAAQDELPRSTIPLSKTANTP